MPDFLLDTDVLIDVLEGHAPTVDALRRMPREVRKLYSVITEAELCSGLPSFDGPEYEAMSHLLAAMHLVPVDGAVAPFVYSKSRPSRTVRRRTRRK